MLINIKKIIIEGLEIQFNGDWLWKLVVIVYFLFSPTASGERPTMPKEREKPETIAIENVKELPATEKTKANTRPRKRF